MTKKVKNNRVKLELEYSIHCSPTILFNSISTASGLSDWFAANVTTKSREDYIFNFEDGETLNAKLVRIIPDTSVRFEWETNFPNEYFEMEIVKYELTQEIALKITEFCDIGDEQSMRETWDAEIEQLKNAIGAKG